MAVNIKLKRSGVAGKVPTTSSLELGEVALNTYDGRAFMKQQVGSTQTVIEFATTAGSGSSVVSASYATSASYAYYATNAGNAATANYATSASHADNADAAISASYALTASYAPGATSASYALSASFAQTSSYANNFNVSGNLVVGGDITAQTLHVQTITSSIIYSSGSNIFGDSTADTQTLNGTVSVSGSFNVTGSATINNLTGSLFGTASWALNAQNATTASYAVNSTTASYSLNAELLDGLDSTAFATTASYNAFTQSYYTDSASFNNRINSLTESVFTHVVTNNGASNYIIDGVTKPILSFVPGATYRFNTSGVVGTHPFKFSTSPNGPTEYTTGVTSGSGYIQIEVNYDTPTTLYYYCTIHSGMGNEIDILRINTLNTGSFSGSFIGTFTGSFSGSLNNLQGTATYIPFFSSSQVLANSAMYQVNTASIAINETNITAADPEALYVFQTHPTSINVVTGKGNLNNYLQNNIQNTNQGVSASSDVVATANNGNETTNYIDMGINSENYAQNFVGGPNDAYLYSAGNDLHIGNITPNKPIQFFAGGSDSDTNRKFQLNPNNQHQMSGSLDISGSLTVRDGITGSLFGTASWALNASQSVSSSYTLNATTASYAVNATSASYAINASTASSADNFIVRGDITGSNALFSGTVTAQTLHVQVITSSTDFVTGSTHFGTQITDTHQFTGSVTISGSLEVNGNATLNNLTGSLYGTASWALNATSASYAASASNAISGGYAVNATSASYATNATSASYSLNSTSASYALTASYASNVPETSSYAVSASYAINATSASYALNSTSGAYALNSTSASYAVNSTSGSYAVNSTSASYALTASYASNVPLTASYAISASNALTASYVNPLRQDVQISGSLGISGSTGTVFSANVDSIVFTGSFAQSGSLTVNGNITTTGTITAQTLNVQVITSSVDFVTGSTRFGTLLANTHQFTGSVSITGSLAVNNSSVITSNQTSSMSVLSSSYALTSSYSNNSTSASYANNATNADTASYVLNAQSASYVLNAISASYAASASNALNAQSASYWSGSIINAESASYALTASYAANVPLTASYANNATSASYAASASNALAAQTASYVLNAQSASYWSGSIINAETASYVLNAISSSYSNNSNSASYALTASFAMNGGGGGLSALYIQDEGTTQGTASYIDFVGAGVTATVSNGTASINIPGGGGGSAVQGASVTFSQPTASTTWSINHAINSRTPVVEVYDSNYNVIIPTGIYNPAPYQTQIYFEVSQSGFAIISTGGVLSVSGSNAILNQATASTTWSFSHELNNLYPVFTIFDSNDDVIIPQRIHVVDTSSAVIYFSSPRTGTAVASIAGNQTFASSSLSASYATTASYVQNAQSASYILLAQSASYVLNAQSASYVLNAISASYVLNAQSASYVLNAVSASYASNATSADTASYVQLAQTASYVQNAQTASFVQNAQTASYILNAVSASYANNATSAATASYVQNAQTASFVQNAVSASYANNATIADTASYVQNAQTASYVQNAQTASYILNAVSASYANNADSATSASYAASASNALAAQTASYVQNAQSASYVQNAQTASFVQNAVSASYVLNAISASYATTASSADNFLVRGTLTAQTLVVQTVTSSVVYSSGSNIFGNDLSNTQILTGSVTVTGSLAVNGSNVILTNQTSSMSVATASYWSGSIINAETASYVQNAQSASYVLNAQSASYWSGSITNASTASYVQNAQTASYVQNAQSASYILNAVSSSYSNNSNSSSYALTASYALFAANGGGGGVSAIYIADEGTIQGTASFFDFTGAGVTATVSNGTASISIPGGGGGGTSGLSTFFTQSVAAVTWSFTHNLNTRTPLVQVYDSSYNQVNPQYISASNGSTVEIGFGIATAGFAVASTGGTLYVTGSNVILDQSVAAATWSFNHNLNTQYPIFQVFNSSNEVMIPEVIKAVDSSSALIYFPTPVTGKAVASLGGLSGSFTASYANNASTASYALTASYSLTGTGFPYSGSAVITGSLLVSGSGISGSFTGSLLGTASYATTASYAMYALTASTAPGYTVQFTQSVSAATWSFTHNMNTRNPIVQVYDSTYKQIIPNDIVGVDVNTAEIRFDYATTGYVVMSNGGGLYVTGSTSELNQTSAAVTWSFTHNLNSKYVNFTVYDSNDFVIIPAGIKAIDSNNAELYFATSQTGRAVAQFSGINGAPNATTASYALTASHATTFTIDKSLLDYASVNSSVVGSNNLFTQATGSYTSAFFQYTVSSGSNARSGQVMSVWNGSTVSFTDVATTDIGSTNDVTGSVVIVSGDVEFNIQTNSAGWRIKSTATFM